MAITVAKKAWMAGILDSKSRVVYKNNKTRNPNHSNQVTLYVESVKIGIVNRLAEMTGTNPELKTPRQRSEGWYRRNCDEHCPEAHTHVNPGVFDAAARWTVSGSAMSVVLTALQPYMVEDRGFTEAIAYGFEHMTLIGQGAAATVAALRRLHGLGWPMPPMIEEARPDLFVKISIRSKNQENPDAAA